MQAAMQQFAPNIARNGFVSDQSAADLSDQMGFVAGSGGLIIRFYYTKIRVEDPVNPSENGQWKTVLCVSKRVMGDQRTEATRIITERMAQQLYPREFSFFKQSQDVPTDGTPLSELPGISQSQIAILVIHNIRSIEELVSLSVDQVGQIGMDARQAYSVAAKWVEAKSSNGQLLRDAAIDAATTAELQRLRKENDDGKAMIAELSAKVNVLQSLAGGLTAGAAPAVGMANGQRAQMVDADDIAEQMPSEDLFVGAQIVTGNDDLNPEAESKSELPGLDKKPRR